ncbi:hypothetical protein EGW08_018612 [Elysia chlorotica]|uniref:N-acetyltransferase domain-containing protein n=1 Tax=Elysia chlorotica TaxID=188477 RepID=A0A433SWE8_ELYCH|nr:hypothetical protein EGW08_018612 [Elysia chlorotica]
MGLEIREATMSDHSAVIDLIDKNGMHDYLPALYPHLVSDPDNFPFVATLHGRVAGYMMASVLDGGLTTLYRSARVGSSFRGMGIQKALLKHLKQFSSEQQPSHMYDTLSSTDRHVENCSHLRAVGYRPVYTREGLQMVYQIPTSPPERAGEDNSGRQIQVRELTRSDLQRMFQANSFCRELFPQGRLFNWYVGYRLMEENIRHLVRPWGGVFASFQDSRTSTFSSSGTTIGISTSSSVTCERDPGNSLDFYFPYNVAMVTFYNCHRSTYGAFYSLDTYAMPGLSRDHFQAHLRHNLKTLRRRFPGQRAALALTFDTTVSKECVTSCLSELGISELLPHQEKRQILYEKPA